MSLKIFTLFFALLLFPLSIFAQSTTLQDVIELQNGSKIRGEIIEKTDNSVKILMQDGTEWIFELTAIKKISGEPLYVPQIPHKIKKKGFYHITEIGYSIDNGTGDPNLSQGFKLNTINGYQFFAPLSVGVGVGLDMYNQDLFLPVFFDLRGDILPKSKFTPFYFGNVGYSFLPIKPIDTEITTFEETGGLFYSYGLGFKVRSNDLQWILSIGQQAQDFYSKTTWRWNEIENIQEVSMIFQRLIVKTGVCF